MNRLNIHVGAMQYPDRYVLFVDVSSGGIRTFFTEKLSPCASQDHGGVLPQNNNPYLVKGGVAKAKRFLSLGYNIFFVLLPKFETLHVFFVKLWCNTAANLVPIEWSYEIHRGVGFNRD